MGWLLPRRRTVRKGAPPCISDSVRPQPPVRKSGEYLIRRREITGGARRPRRLELDEALPDGVADQARGVVNAELLHEIGSVRLGGLDSDTEEPGDLLRGLAFGHELQDLALARSEMVDRRGRSAQVGLDDGLSHAGTEIDRACLHVAD